MLTANVLPFTFRRRPGRDDSWSATVAGLSKRDLLREVLSVFGSSSIPPHVTQALINPSCHSTEQDTSKPCVSMARHLEEGTQR